MTSTRPSSPFTVRQIDRNIIIMTDSYDQQEPEIANFMTMSLENLYTLMNDIWNHRIISDNCRYLATLIGRRTILELGGYKDSMEKFMDALRTTIFNDRVPEDSEFGQSFTRMIELVGKGRTSKGMYCVQTCPAIFANLIYILRSALILNSVTDGRYTWVDLKKMMGRFHIQENMDIFIDTYAALKTEMDDRENKRIRSDNLKVLNMMNSITDRPQLEE